MKILLLFFLSLFLPSISFATITKVQSCKDTAEWVNSFFTTDSCNFPSGTKAGDTIIVYCQGSGGNATYTVSDDHIDSYTLATNTNQFATTGGQGQAIFYSAGVPAGVQNVACNFSSRIYVAIVAYEFSGLAASNVFDQGAGTTSSSGSGTNAPVGPMTTTVKGDLIYVAYLDSNTFSFSATAGTVSLPYVLLSDLSSSVSMADETAIQSTAGSVTGSMTDSIAGNPYAISMASFKADPNSFAVRIAGHSIINKAHLGF